MSVLQLPSTLYVRKISGEETFVPLCKFIPNENGELNYIVMRFVFVAEGGNEFANDNFLKLKIMTSDKHADVDTATAYAQSNTITITDITTSTETVVDVRFDFNRENIYKENDYYLYLIPDGLSSASNSFFASYVMDTSDPVTSFSYTSIDDIPPYFVVNIYNQDGKSYDDTYNTLTGSSVTISSVGKIDRALVRVKRTADQSVGTTSQTLVNFTSTDYNPWLYFTIASDVFTAPVDGVYFFILRIGLTAVAASTSANLYIYLNGASIRQKTFLSTSTEPTTDLCELLELDAGDEISMYIQSPDGNYNVESSFVTSFNSYLVRTT